jgi:predicted phosphodiesterase
MLIQYISDLHLEMKEPSVIPKLLKNINADILVLAGDICTVASKQQFDKFLTLLNYYKTRYKYILHVAGNHEYYVDPTDAPVVTINECMKAVDTKFKYIMKNIPNYIYLNCTDITLEINKKLYRFIGATLWTKVQKKNQEEIQNSMNDYDCIYINDKNGKINKYTVQDMQRIHAKHLSFIKKAIAQASVFDVPVILITHHKTLIEPDTMKQRDPVIRQAYENDMSEIIKPPIKVVIWGHTHEHCYKKIKGITYTSNPKGYPSQHTLFDADLGVKV